MSDRLPLNTEDLPEREPKAKIDCGVTGIRKMITAAGPAAARASGTVLALLADAEAKLRERKLTIHDVAHLKMMIRAMMGKATQDGAGIEMMYAFDRIDDHIGCLWDQAADKPNPETATVFFAEARDGGPRGFER